MNYSEYISIITDKTVKELSKYVIDNHIPYEHRGGHTWQTANLEYVHTVLLIPRYFSDMLIAGKLDEAERMPMLEKLAENQIKGTSTREDGNFLWYAEETRIQDLNAAFFIVSVLLKLRMLASEKLTVAERELIDRMMSDSLVWFEKFCDTAELYYPNSTLSNISCMYGVSATIGDKERLQKAKKTLEKYFEYIDRRGWGWGENISPSYIMEIIVPLKIISVSAHRLKDGYTAVKADELLEKLFDYIRFQRNFDFVPAIRNYNVKGLPKNYIGGRLFAGVTDDIKEINISLLNAMLFKDEIENYEENHRKFEAITKQDLYVQKIFDGASSTTWCGENIHLGTVNEYPFMPSVFQNPTWGTGWQSMPVAFTVKDEQLSYLRWVVTTGDRRRTFPHEQRLKPNDINASMFNEFYYPDVYTVAAQNKNLALVIRRMNGLHNSCKLIADEFAIANFKGEPELYNIGGVDWAVLKWKGKATVLIAALQGITLHREGENAPVPQCVSVLGPDHPQPSGNIAADGKRCLQHLKASRYSATGTEYLTLSQTVYEGDEQRLDFRAVETSWAIVALDYELGNAKEYIENNVKLSLDSAFDFEAPRWEDSKIAKMSLTADGKTLEFNYDPYTRKYMM